MMITPKGPVPMSTVPVSVANSGSSTPSNQVPPTTQLAKQVTLCYKLNFSANI